MRVNDYIASHPEAGFPEIRERFFQHYRDPVPIRIISGRNVEAAATRTVQLLFEGAYDGYFQPDQHYIPLKKDLSNVDEALEKFRDEAYCRHVTAQACELAMAEFRYDRLIDVFADTLADSI